MADDEIIKKHTKAAYKAWVTPGTNWKHKLKDILLEITIIVFAVSISIWFHNWSENRKDHKEEKDFLSSLKKDLQDDRSEMIGDKDGLMQVLQGLYYFKKIGEGVTLNTDSLNKYQWIFYINAQINPRIGRYEALKGSGKLGIIENADLLKNITDLYQKNFSRIFRKNENLNTLLENYMIPFLEDHLHFDKKNEGNNWEEILRIPKMRLLVLQATRINNNIQVYSDGIDKINEILAQIDKELK